MSTPRSTVDEDAVVILASFHPPRLLSGGRGSKDLRHSPATLSCQDNDVHPHPFGTAAKMHDRATSPVAPVRTDQSALDQGGKDLA
jgi:hypothetical protein